jgi:hypothetical protein
VVVVLGVHLGSPMAPAETFTARIVDRTTVLSFAGAGDFEHRFGSLISAGSALGSAGFYHFSVAVPGLATELVFIDLSISGLGDLVIVHRELVPGAVSSFVIDKASGAWLISGQLTWIERADELEFSFSY